MENVFIVIVNYSNNRYCDWEEHENIEGVFASFESAEAFIKRNFPDAFYESDIEAWVEKGQTDHYEYDNTICIVTYRVET